MSKTAEKLVVALREAAEFSQLEHAGTYFGNGPQGAVRFGAGLFVKRNVGGWDAYVTKPTVQRSKTTEGVVGRIAVVTISGDKIEGEKANYSKAISARAFSWVQTHLSEPPVWVVDADQLETLLEEDSRLVVLYEEK